VWLVWRQRKIWKTRSHMENTEFEWWQWNLVYISLVFGSEMFRFFYQHNNSIYCGNGSETFRFLLPVQSVWKRDISLLLPTSTIVCIVGMEAKHFTSCCPLVFGSELFRFLHVNTTILNGIYCGNGSEIVAHLTVWKRAVSLLVTHWLLQAKCFAFPDTI
jgi:hypothetical protein